MDRSDAGLDITTKHTNINLGEPKMAETDLERQARTGLSSLQITDNESREVQKTPHRVSLESMLEKIVSREVIHPNCLPSMTIMVVKLENGYVLVGKSTPADPENYNEELGIKFAFEDAIRQMWPLEAYLLRERMSL